MGTSYTKLSNIIGAPFSYITLKQLYTRAKHNSSVDRTPQEVLFLANKTGWARLASSVNIELEGDKLKKFYADLGVTGNVTLNSDGLAKNWILEAGTSIQANESGITLREGIGPDGAYGLGGTEEMGYRPMPGLTSVQIETTGRLGSLRQATVSFKVWNMNQLNVIEALYFRLGYSMLLEWGHTQYFQNDDVFKTNGVYGIDDPFATGLRKEGVQQAIATKARETDGNYDGMLGIVSNFTWSFNQDGGYDCTVRLVGLGAVMDSTRINQEYTLPVGVEEEYEKEQTAISDAYELQLAKEEQEKEARKHPPTVQLTLDPVPNSPRELMMRAKKYNNFEPNGTLGDFQAKYGLIAITNVETIASLKSRGNPFVPIEEIGHIDYNITFNQDTNPAIQTAAQNKYGGLWINHPWTRIPSFSNVNFNADLFDTYSNNLTVERGGDDVRTIEVSRGKTGVSRYFDVNTDTAFPLTGKVSVPLTSPLYTPTIEIKYKDIQIHIKNFGDHDAYFDPYVKLKVVTGVGEDSVYSPTRQQLIDALDAWVAQPDHTLLNTRIVQESFFSLKEVRPDDALKHKWSGNPNEVIVTGNFTTQIGNVAYSGPQTLADIQKAKEVNSTLLKTVNITWTVTTNNTGFITNIGNPNPNYTTTAQAANGANSGDAGGVANQPTTSQVDSTAKFGSALQAMLVLVQTHCQAEAIKTPQAGTGGKVVDLQEMTGKFYNDGSLNGVLTEKPTITTNSNGVPFNVLQYALKGFNSNLMVDPSLFSSVPTIKFADLCQGYVLKYTQGGPEDSKDLVHSPVYIQFGYLLAFLNNMCLIYESTQKTATAVSKTKNDQHPYIYIDFNPETNFCLTSPQQFSIDPFTCLIPFNATLDQYKSIYPENIADKLVNLFNPGKDNVVSNLIQSSGLKFKTDQDSYQGRTMNILLNVDYLLGIVGGFASSDNQNGVYLQPFLERILIDVNKSLGNTNAFRVAYRDDSNTVQIQDDQWVPNGTDPTMLKRSDYLASLKTDREKSGLLPIFGGPAPGQLPVAGVQSLARQFQLQTTLSTKLSSMIAVSAQADTTSVNATDHSSLSWLNKNYNDRYKPSIQDQSSPKTSGTDKNTPSTVASASFDEKVAQQVNDHVSSVYSNLMLSADRVLLAKNYYIERMSKVKSGDPITTAAPFIPANVEMTIDGISGIIMGNAFTIPESRLPLSLRGDDGFTKVAFIVVGLTHTIQNNEWLTRIRGQMIKLREDIDKTTVLATTTISGTQNTLAGAFLVSSATATATATPAADVKGNAAIAIKFLKGNGFSDTAIAAIVGSFKQESNVDPSAVNINSKLPYNDQYQTYAAGIAQWVGPRRVRLLKYARSKGAIIQGYNEAVAIKNNATKTPQSGAIVRAAFAGIDLNTQLNFFAIEVAEFPNFNTFKTTTDLNFAVKWVYEVFEGNRYQPQAAFGRRGVYAAGVLKSIQAGQV